MNRILIAAVLAISILACSGARALSVEDLKLVPWPVKVELGQGELAISPALQVVAGDETLLPLAKVLAGEIRNVTGVAVKAVQQPTATEMDAWRGATIYLQTDAALKGEAYAIDVTALRATLRGGNYEALAWATVTLLQSIQTSGDKKFVPVMKIEDQPAAPVRMVMWDIARQWHPLESLHELVELHRMYKVRYMHLFMGARGLFVFGSKAFPELGTVQDGKVMYRQGLQLPPLGTRMNYSIEEIKALVKYAQERGVIIVPQIDQPGWSGQMVDKRPDIFCGKGNDPATGKPYKTSMLNVNNEAAVEGMKTLIGELCEAFYTSPYIHIGADEVGAKAFEKFPFWAEHSKKYNLKNGNEALAHYLYRLDQCVKEHGKTSICWIGPKRVGKGYDVSPDLITMPWLSSGQNEAADNFFVIRPGGGHFMPFAFAIQGVKGPYNKILGYRPAEGTYNRLQSLKRFEAAGSDDFYTALKPEYLPPTGKEDRIVGAQIQEWQTSHDMTLPAMRVTMPALGEPLWNQQDNPDRRNWKDFSRRLQATDAILDRTMRPVQIECEGLTDPKDITFTGTLKVRLTSPVKGTIRYTLGSEWFDKPTKNSPAYTGPITIKVMTVVNARLFDEAGDPVGYAIEKAFYPITPKARYQFETADGKTIKGVLGNLTLTPSHEDARMGQKLTLEGSLRVPADGEYEFMLPRQGVQLFIDGKPVDGKTQLKAGVFAFQVIGKCDKDKLRVRVPDVKVPKDLDTWVIALEGK